jgi:methyltransferase (TIGR00027 family)
MHGLHLTILNRTSIRFIYTMRPGRSSRTAEYMAFFRALESLCPPASRLFCDPFAANFLRPLLRFFASLARVPLFASLVAKYADRRLPGACTSAIARTRWIDDALNQAFPSEIPQMVILGAGFDCRAYRLPSLSSTAVFEIDHPATLALKRTRLMAVLKQIPGHVRFVEMDFHRESLAEVLHAAGFEKSRPALFLWEGVTNYLTQQAVDAVLCFVAQCASGSRLIFTYVHAGALDGSVAFDGAPKILEDVAQIGEPWTFGLFPEGVPAFLRQHHLILDCDVSAREYRAQYFGSRADRMRGYDFYHVALAHVPDPRELAVAADTKTPAASANSAGVGSASHGTTRAANTNLHA